MYETGFSCCVLFLLLLSALSEHTYILFTSVILFVVLFIEGFVSFPTSESKIVCFHFLLPVNFKKVHFVFA